MYHDRNHHLYFTGQHLIILFNINYKITADHFFFFFAENALMPLYKVQ